jgi:dienelactone hydrolase
VTFKSKGAAVHAMFYRAPETEPSPTVILCQGFPGNNADVLGLGGILMKEGFNALVFNYRGTWGSEGRFTNANSLEDVIAAVRYARSTAAVEEFNIDPSSIALAGYSYGGGMALLGSLSDPAIRRIVAIAGGNLGEAARMIQHDAELRRALEEDMDHDISVSGFKAQSAKEFSAEILADGDKYDLVQHAQPLSRKDILIIAGWRDQMADIEHHILPFIRALQKHKARQVQMEIFDTDHSFMKVRSQLADRIVTWLKRTPS